VHVEGHVIAKHVVTGSCQLVGDRLQRHHCVGLGALALIEAPDGGVVAHRMVGRLDEGPGEIPVAVFGIAPTLALAIAEVRAAHTSAVGGIVARSRETGDITGLEHDGKRQHLAYPWYRKQRLEGGL